MPELTRSQIIQRQKYVATHAPLLLAHILQGVLAGGNFVNAKECARVAIESAEALHDGLILEIDT